MLKNKKSKKINKLKAFTLVEVLVSLFLFITIAGILTQIYISTIRSERIAYVLLRDENIIRNELESLARDIRMGRDFHTLDDDTSLNYRTYYDNNWKRISYRFNAESFKIEKSVNEFDFETISLDYKQVIPDNIKVDMLNFFINKDMKEQPSITITLTVSSEVYGKPYVTKLQTTVTPRMLDF